MNKLRSYSICVTEAIEGVWSAELVSTVPVYNVATEYPLLAKATGHTGAEAMRALAEKWERAGFAE